MLSNETERQIHVVAPLPVREPTRTALRIQTRTLEALIVRFLVTRYGRHGLGFVWVVLEPIMLTIAVMIMWSFIKPAYQHGVHIVGLVLTGYMPLTLWRHLSNAGVHGLRNSKNLLFHRNVTYLDAIVSRLVLEFLGTTAALVLVTTILLALGILQPVHDYGLVFVGWLLMGALSFGFACVLAAISEMSETVEKFVQPVQYMIVPLSGVFFMVGWLPASARDLILYVPLVHSYEATRAGFFGPSVQTYYDLEYGFGCALAVAAAGIWLMQWVRDRV